MDSLPGGIIPYNIHDTLFRPDAEISPVSGSTFPARFPCRFFLDPRGVFLQTVPNFFAGHRFDEGR